jgi:predicted transcriptional regulator
MEIKVFDSELKVMEVLWNEGDLRAGQLAKILKGQTGWSYNTTYTVIKKLIAKGAIERREPNFICRAMISKEQVRQYELAELMGKLFDNSAAVFLSAFLHSRKLSAEEAGRLKQIVENMK